MNTTFDRSQSLEQLENDHWGNSEVDSEMITKIHQLRRKPLNEFTVEDLRIMIGQNVGLNYLIPLAVERLIEDPLISADLYRGDLLKNVLNVEQRFWNEHVESYYEVESIVVELELLRDTIENQLMPSTEIFRAIRPDQRTGTT